MNGGGNPTFWAICNPPDVVSPLIAKHHFDALDGLISAAFGKP